jgi:hypothetical protein
MLLMTEMLGHLLVQRRFQHALGELLQQPIRARQDSPRSRASRTSSVAAVSSAEGSGLFFFGTISSVVITTLSPLILISALGRKHP